MPKYCPEGEFWSAIMNTTFPKSCPTDLRGYGWLF